VADEDGGRAFLALRPVKDAGDTLANIVIKFNMFHCDI
jgi:hypothetical protein